MIDKFNMTLACDLY